MKKIVSLLLASAMALSLTAVSFAARTPSVDVTVNPIAYNDADAWLAENWEDSMANYDDYGMYEIVFDLNDIGTLNRSLKQGKVTGTVLTHAQFDMELVGDETAVDDIIWVTMDPASSITTGSAKGGTANTSYYNGFMACWTEQSDMKNAYPNTNGTIDNASVAGIVKFYLLAPNGTEFKANAKSYMQVTPVTSGTPGAVETVSLTFDNFVLAAEDIGGGEEGGDEEDVLTFTIAEGTIYENGTVWACTIANAVDGLAKLEATFKAGEATKSVITTKLAAWGGEGATAFNIGINTSKAGVVADAIAATITDGAGATATAEAAAN